jgi:hypothetical protein
VTETNTAIENVVEADAPAAEAAAPAQPKRRDYSNLRNRPFLVIKTIQRPVKPSITRRKGWAEAEGNWQIFEHTSVVDRVSDKTLREATVIIDVMRSTCVTNRFSHVTDTEVVHHYLGKYGTQVKEAMGLWLRKTAQKMAQDPNFARNLAEKATEEALAATMAPPVEAAPDAPAVEG